MALAALVAWRGRVVPAAVLAAAGVLLALAAALVPTRLGPVQRAWMSLAHALSRITTPIVMGITYFLILTPVGLVRRAMGRRLRAAEHGEGFWVPVERARATDMHRQF